MKFILLCSSGPLREFRLPELESIATLFNFKLTYLQGTELDTSKPYMLVELASEVEANLLGSRSISVKSIWHYWADATTYGELHTLLAADQLWLPYQPLSISWKFSVETYCRTFPAAVHVALIESFKYMDLEGPIRMKSPDVEIGIMEDYDHIRANVVGEEVRQMKRVWIGRKVCTAQRQMIDRFDLKKRAYIGTTSMEAEVSLLMTNQSLAAPGKLVYDPFAGTGSLLLTSAAFGALTFGSDIDGRQIRGKTTSIHNNAEQYGLTAKLVDCAVFDVTQHPFRTGSIFDAIITDPPYGVRAGAKRIGRKLGDNGDPRSLPHCIPGREDEGPIHQMSGYVPPLKPWEMTSVIHSLLTLSHYLLKPRGRLVFFLPTDNSAYKEDDIPDVRGMRLVSNSLQDYGKWGRRLITMEKVSFELQDDESEVDELVGGLDRVELGLTEAEREKVGHSGFRDRYFESFQTG